MLKSDGSGNFNDTGDGYAQGSTYHQVGVNGYTRANLIINTANVKMSENYQMALLNLGILINNTVGVPSNTNRFIPNNTTPTLPKRVQFVLGRVYFHRDDTWYNNTPVIKQDPYSDAIDAQFGVQVGSTINVYYVYDPYVNVKDPITGEVIQYNTADGVASSIPPILNYDGKHLAIKMKDWQSNYQSGDVNASDAAHLLCHEVGHTLGLAHDWFNGNNCSDTPTHNNCWTLDNNNPNCNDYSKITNNTMSYFGGYHEVLTPCQIGIIHDNLDGLLKNYVDHCAIDCNKINSDLFLDVSPLNLYAASTSIVSSAIIDGSRTVINEAPNITLTSTTYSTYNLGSNNYSTTHNFEVKLGTTFIAKPYTCDPVQGLMVAPTTEPKKGMANTIINVLLQESPESDYKSALKVYPSPTKGVLNIEYSLSGISTPNISILNITGEVVQTVKKSEQQSKGNYKIVVNGDSFSNGVYFVVLESGDNRLVEKFVIQK